MFFYQLGYSGYEDHSCANLCHENEYNEEQWEKIVLEASKKGMKISHDRQLSEFNSMMVPHYMEKAEKARTDGDLWGYAYYRADAESPNVDMSFSEGLDDVVKVLMEEYGFQPVVYA